MLRTSAHDHQQSLFFRREPKRVYSQPDYVETRRMCLLLTDVLMATATVTAVHDFMNEQTTSKIRELSNVGVSQIYCGLAFQC